MVKSRFDLTARLTADFRAAGIEFPSFDARQLTAQFYDGSEQSVKQTEELARRRINGEPLQYLLGEWEFYGLPFSVGEGVLIPRPETEMLVDCTLRFTDGKKGLKIADLCSGSGCIAVTLALNTENCRVIAVEKSAAAFKYLKRNIERNHADVDARLGDAADFSEKCDIVVSNPPYIKSSVIPTLAREVLKEPKAALDGGADGLFFYKTFARNAANMLKNGGKLLLEIGFDQAAEVENLLKTSGFSDVEIFKDLSGNDRVIIGTYTL